MKTKETTAILATLALLTLPAISSANTYQYIDSSGKLQSTQASSPTEALSSAYNIGVNSGVILASISGTSVVTTTPAPTTTNTSGSFYQFIDSSGNIQSVNATSPSQALALAYNIGTYSGVILVTNKSSI